MAENERQDDVEAALLDAELFLKYRSPRKAIERLLAAVKLKPHSVRLRESLREIAAAGGDPQEAARQCLALVQIYLEREDFDTAQERLIEARALDPRISVTRGLEAIRRARRPDLAAAQSAPATHSRRGITFAGDLSVVSLFDAVQVVENARLTGSLNINASDTETSRVLFNDGRIVGAEAEGQTAELALRRVLELTGGEFDFERAPAPFPVTIQASSNTSLLLDTLRELDEEKQNS
jgi:tetratricopeptide (TPR) repeat protein